MSRIVTVLPGVLCLAAVLATAFVRVPGEVLGTAVSQPGEEYTYEVSWTWFKLGRIRLQTLADGRAEAHIDSYPNIPFVDLHSVHFTKMDSLCFSRASLSMEKYDSVWKGMDYVYDLPEKKLIVEDIQLKSPTALPDSRAAKDTILLPSAQFLDGLSIAYYPRRFVHTDTIITVPTVLYGKLGETTFEFHRQQTTESIDALENPVKVVEINGSTSAVGIYGMTGEFTGWFSDDSAAVPIKGKLKVLIGSVSVELVNWNRRGWSPPQ